MPSGPRLTVKEIGGKLACKNSSNVRVKVESDGNLTVIKTVSNLNRIEWIKKEAAIHKTMNHPLIVKCFPTPLNHSPAITTEFVRNGSLANHLSDPNNPDFSLLKYPTKIVNIVAQIVLAMRFVHSQSVIHRNLTPENILLDWDWKIRIANFGCSTFTDCLTDPDGIPRGDAHYLAPECYENVVDIENDIFSFGLILYELIVGQPAFPKRMTPENVAGALIRGDWEPKIPDSVLPRTKELICDCLAPDYRERPSFSEILNRLEEMRFKLTAGVNSSKVTAFVKEITEWETNNRPQ
jgi:serine/threonine protein kinase